MSTSTPSFNDALEVVAQLSIEEQEDLIGIASRRVAEAKRQRLIERVNEATQEFKDGHYSPASPDAIMREILE
jgi:hypothetical protein